jgi:hypothetical protein
VHVAVKIAAQSSNLATGEARECLDPYVHAFVDPTIRRVEATLSLVVLPGVHSHSQTQRAKGHNSLVEVALS